MTLTLTTTLSAAIDKTELESNFSSIANKFSGAIDNSDIKTGAGIDVTKLNAYKEYVTVTLARYDYTWGSAEATVAMAALPGLSAAQSTWTLAEANWFISDTGSSAGSFDVYLGYYDGNGDLQKEGTELLQEVSLTVTVDGKGNSGEAAITNATVAYHSSTPRLLVLRQGGTVGTGVLNSAGTLGVTLLLERNIQAP
jgi:hypothetical protein